MTVIDSGVTCGGAVILADALQRRLERGTTEEELLAVVERFKRTRGLLFTVETLEYLVRGGRVGKARARRPAPEREADPPLRRRRGGAAQARARSGEGARRVRGALPRGDTEDSPTSTSASATPTRRGRGEAGASGSAPRARAPRSTSSTTLGPVIGTHGGPGTLGLFWFQDEPVLTAAMAGAPRMRRAAPRPRRGPGGARPWLPGRGRARRAGAYGFVPGCSG